MRLQYSMTKAVVLMECHYRRTHTSNYANTLLAVRFRKKIWKTSLLNVCYSVIKVKQLRNYLKIFAIMTANSDICLEQIMM